MTSDDELTFRLIDYASRAMREASDRRLAETPQFTLPDRPADRSRNGRRARSTSRRRRFIL